MKPPESPTKTLTIDEARQRIDEILRQAAKSNTRAVIEEDGRPVAAIVSPVDFEQLKRDDARRREDFEAMAQIGEAFMDVSIEELEREIAKAL
jgi:prevent-host-death family protein